MIAALIAVATAYLALKTVACAIDIYTWALNFKVSRAAQKRAAQAAEKAVETMGAMQAEFSGRMNESRAQQKARGEL